MRSASHDPAGKSDEGAKVVRLWSREIEGGVRVAAGEADLRDLADMGAFLAQDQLRSDRAGPAPKS